jgi:hypothetical protein
LKAGGVVVVENGRWRWGRHGGGLGWRCAVEKEHFCEEFTTGHGLRESIPSRA